MLVGGSIYQACKFYELFCQAASGQVRDRHQLRAEAGDISKEDAGEGATEGCASTRSTARCWPTTSTSRPTPRRARSSSSRSRSSNSSSRSRGQMRLLIVVDKLLTGFDAPSATYLYIDKKMRDHGLFQAICRVNRLDGDDKDYGYIVDYRDLFNSLESAITDYTAGALDGYEKEDVEGSAHGPDREGPRGPGRGARADPRPLRTGRATEEHAAYQLTSARSSRATPSSSRRTSRSGSSSTSPSPRLAARLRAISPTTWEQPVTPPRGRRDQGGGRPLRHGSR